jgi:hypothetical protein
LAAGFAAALAGLAADDFAAEEDLVADEDLAATAAFGATLGEAFFAVLAAAAFAGLVLVFVMHFSSHAPLRSHPEFGNCALRVAHRQKGRRLPP